MVLATLAAKLEGRFRYSRTLLLGRRNFRMRNTNPIISFTFDDFPYSALHRGGRILEENGLVGTFYVALGLMNRESPVGRICSEEDLRQVVERGHELGCHTYDHFDSWKTPSQAFEDSVIRNREELARAVPGRTFATMSYPLDIPRPQTKRRVAKYFAAARGCSQRLNAGTIDLNFLRAFFLEQRANDDAVKALIDENCRRSGWLIFATHDIAPSPSRFGCTATFFELVVRYAVETRTMILPVEAAVREISRRSESGAERFREEIVS